MEIIFFSIIFFSIVILLFSNPTLILSSMQNGATKAINLSIQLLSVYSLWLGILELVDKSKLSEKLAILIKPIISILFVNLDKDTENLIALNITSNILGMSNASTPSGIQAMEKFSKNHDSIYPSRNMIMLTLLNCCAIQILPSTILSLRIQFNSNSPSNILLPNIIVSFLTTFIAIMIALIIENKKSKVKK